MAMTLAYDDGYSRENAPQGRIRTITATWTSDGSGNASATTDKINGVLLKGVTDPGTAAPTANYDIALTDSDGANLLQGCADDLADRHTSNTETVHFLVSDGTAGIAVHPACNSTITIAVTNAGASKEGVLILYYEVC